MSHLPMSHFPRRNNRFPSDPLGFDASQPRNDDALGNFEIERGNVFGVHLSTRRAEKRKKNVFAEIQRNFTEKRSSARNQTDCRNSECIS